MNEQNFLKQMQFLVTGDYILAEVELALYSAVRTTGGVPLDGSSAPTAVDDGASFDDGDTADLHFTLPHDYNPTNDICRLVLLEVPSADAAHTTDLGITTAQSIFRDGAAEDATVSTAVAEDATASTDQLVREQVIDISGRGYQPGDHIRLLLDGNGNGTTEIILVGLKLRYGSSLVADDIDARQ